MRMRVATGAEFKAQSVLERFGIIGFHQVLRHHLYKKLNAESMQEDDDICIILRPAVALCLFFA